MKKKIDIEKIQVALNGLKMKMGNKEMTAKEANDLLASAGVSHNIRGLLSEKIFIRRSEGTKRFYTFKKEAIYGGLIENLYKSFYEGRTKKPTPTLTEESAVSFLKQLGYKLSKPVGLDKERMKKENHALYEKYMLYKEL